MSGGRKRVRVGLLFGGRSPEHEVSITTAASIAAAADPDRLEIIPIYISREGTWLRLRGSEEFARLAGQFVGDQVITRLPRDEVVLRGSDTPGLVPIAGAGDMAAPIDVLFPALHGHGGEDGSVQGLASLVDLPCVGAGILGSSLGMDKIATKRIAEAHAVRIPPFVAFTRARWNAKPDPIREEVTSKLTMPIFVKPSGAGSSVGITKLDSLDRLDPAIADAARYDYRLLVEQGIDARELEVAVLGNDEPETSVVGEIVPIGEFYDYRGKYVDEGSKLIIPAEIPQQISEEIRTLAVKMFLALDLSGMARADFLLSRAGGELYFNEVNTIPGFTPISMYPRLWEASGVGYRDLISRLVELAIERHAATRVEVQPPNG